jgi:hypothetical protein
MLFNKMKNDFDESERKNKFYEYRRHYWQEMGFNGPPPGRENEFSFGSPAYVAYCQRHNKPIDFPPQNHQY